MALFPQQAQQDMSRVADELVRRFPQFNTGWTAQVVPYTFWRLHMWLASWV